MRDGQHDLETPGSASTYKIKINLRRSRAPSRMIMTLIQMPRDPLRIHGCISLRLVATALEKHNVGKRHPLLERIFWRERCIR